MDRASLESMAKVEWDSKNPNSLYQRFLTALFAVISIVPSRYRVKMAYQLCDRVIAQHEREQAQQEQANEPASGSGDVNTGIPKAESTSDSEAKKDDGDDEPQQKKGRPA